MLLQRTTSREVCWQGDGRNTLSGCGNRSRLLPIAVRDFGACLVSPEGKARLRAGRPQGGRFGRWGFVRAKAERIEQAELEVSEEQCSAAFESAGGGVVQDAQQHEGDQRDIDLHAHGVFTAAEKAADLEVLLEPFEEQLDLPARFIEW